MSQDGGARWVDLARADLGGMVIAANDEFFAAKENLILPAEPSFDPAAYYDRGKWMDGWETRRRREPGHDWAVIRLAAAGIVRELVIDTSFFTGNYPPGASIEGAFLPGYPSPAEVLHQDVTWVPILDRVDLAGNSKNRFTARHAAAVTHLRLNIFPDGGVARLRAFGEPFAPWSRLGELPDLASVLHGGRVLAVSDEFYSVRHNLLSLGRAAEMKDGWEVRRRRDGGNDWCVVRLGAAGTPAHLEIDTNHFKGNCPGAVQIEVAAWPGELPADHAEIPWRTLVPRLRLQPHTRHLLREELREVGEIDLVRLSIFPDGGISRFRLWGRPSVAAIEADGVRLLDHLPEPVLRQRLTDCCGSSRWVQGMIESRPWREPATLRAAADAVWADMEPADHLEAFSHHPRIGERRKVAAQSDTAGAWSKGEQAAVAVAADATLERLAALNAEYEARFGHIYIVCAAGRSADELLALLEARLGSDPEAERAVAAAEQHRITHLRLTKLLSRGA